MIRFWASFDDASAEDSRIAELMAKHYIPTTFYWPVLWEYIAKTRNRSALSQYEADEIAKHFDIGCHTMSHRMLTRIPVSELRSEIVGSREILEGMFEKPITSFCPPRGYYNGTVKQVVKKAGYESLRTTQVGHLDKPRDPFETHTTVHVGYNRKEYKGKTWLEYALSKLIEAEKRSQNSFYYLWGHGWELEQNNSWNDLSILLKAMSAV